MRLKLISGLLLALLSAAPALAFEPFVVKDIRVEGLQRTEAGTVFNYLPVKIGQSFSEEKAAQTIKALYATGFFKDVRLEVDGNVLVVIIEERPAIGTIDFEGNRAFESDKLRKGLREAGISESRILDRALLERAEQELKRQYLNRSYYAATITTEVKPLDRNRVALRFKVREGEIASIRQINLTGNQVFSTSELKSQMTVRPKHWLRVWNWFSSDHEYSKPKLQGDLETLRSYYLNRGYLDFNIEASQVSITPDKLDVYIAIAMAEGQQYKVSNVRLAGNLVLPDDEIKALVTLRPGDVFSRERLTETTKQISDRLADMGYAFANVNAAPEVDKDKRQVAFTIFVDPGKRVYVRRVNVMGNTRTRDEVIRREIRQLENAWYDGAKIRKSKQRIDRLGFFEDSTIETPPVPGTPDQVDLNVTVKERATGNLLFGAGYSTTDKIVLQASLSQNNMFGSGNALSLNVNTGRTNRTIVVSYTDPYFTIDGVTLGYDVYHRNYEPYATTTVGYYKTSSTGAGIRLGYPIGEDDALYLGLTADSTKITVNSSSPQQYISYVNQFGERASSLVASVSWGKDLRDSSLTPTKGSYQHAGFEVSVPPADLRYVRANYQFQYFQPVLLKDDTLQLRASVGYALGYDGKPVPFFKNYYAGGIGSVRGYKDNSLGPQIISSIDGASSSIGGTRQLLYGAEYFFTPPATGIDKTFRLSVFADAGQVWGKDEPLRMSDVRYSAGLGFAWISPVGPLKMSFGRPLRKKTGDNAQLFQFQMGNIF